MTGVPTDSVTCEKCGTLMDSRENRSFLAYARMTGTTRPKSADTLTDENLDRLQVCLS